MALFASRFLASSRSDSLRGTALAIHTSRTPAIEHCSALRTYAAKAASPRTRKKSLDAQTVNDVTKESKAKGPRTAYALFQKEQGSQILAKHKAGSIGERSQILAAEWKKVSADEKASLQARVVLDSPKLPAKLPRSAYQLWMKQAGSDILSKLGGTFDNVGQRAKALSAEWKKVSEEEKARLQGELEKIAPARKRPAKKTATSAYAFYVQEQFSSHRKAGMDTKDVMKALGAAWSTLSVSEKEAYKGKAGQSS